MKKQHLKTNLTVPINFKEPRCQEDHVIVDYDDGVYAIRLRDDDWPPGRYGAELYESATLRKTKNLIALLEELSNNGSLENIDVDGFCRRRDISKLTFERLLAVMAYCIKIPYNGCIKVKHNQTNRRYKLILTLYYKMKHFEVNSSDFCKRHKISRSTFFRYLNIIDAYLSTEYSIFHIGIRADGKYRIIFA